MAQLIRQSEYAQQKGVSRAYINKLVKLGKIPLTDGKIDPDVADLALASGRERLRVDSKIPPPSAPSATAPRPASDDNQAEVSAGLTLIEAKTILDTYKGKREKLRYAREQRKVAAIEDVERLMAAANSDIRQRLLHLPTKLTPRIAALGSNKQKINDLLKKEIYETLEELAKPLILSAGASA